MFNDPRLTAIAAAHPYPLVFATVSGAHLYGFESPDSDVDLRGAHVLPLKEVVGLEDGPETVEQAGIRDGLELDLVTHDIKKFCRLLLNKNGYVLEQLTSPLIVQTSPAHQELVALAPKCLTRHHAHHYFGFAATQWKLFDQEGRLKPLLYTFRVLLTGIHLMRSGEVEANLSTLNGLFRLPYLDELIRAKREGSERAQAQVAEPAYFRKEYDRLRGDLEEAYAASALAERPSAAAAMHDLLVRVRLGQA
ncbi:MAG: putative nucleotidyltransferase [Cyanobacteria bacterium RYN_339]|nr:putative nucleotidyltransferase [Cyanobacteria bacterium RYN_339]